MNQWRIWIISWAQTKNVLPSFRGTPCCFKNMRWKQPCWIMIEEYSWMVASTVWRQNAQKSLCHISSAFSNRLDLALSSSALYSSMPSYKGRRGLLFVQFLYSSSLTRKSGKLQSVTDLAICCSPVPLIAHLPSSSAQRQLPEENILRNQWRLRALAFSRWGICTFKLLYWTCCRSSLAKAQASIWIIVARSTYGIAT